MHLSEIKAQIAAAAAQSTEAFQEISNRIKGLESQVDGLIAAASDPDVDDDQFLNNLQTLKSNVGALADIVPNAPPAAPVIPPAPADPGLADPAPAPEAPAPETAAPAETPPPPAGDTPAPDAANGGI